MNSFLDNIGVIAIVIIIIYCFKKIIEHEEEKHISFYESKKIYEAAEKFSKGASSDDVAILLESSLEFDATDAEKVLSLSLPHRSDTDGGYNEFINSVNKVLKGSVYNGRYHI